MSNVLTDSEIVFSNLVDSTTGKTIVMDISQMTLPERYRLSKIQDQVRAHAESFGTRFKLGMIGG